MNLTLRLIVILGFVFEMPILIMGLARMRVVHWRKLLGWWRMGGHRLLRRLGDRDAHDRPRDAVTGGDRADGRPLHRWASASRGSCARAPRLRSSTRLDGMTAQLRMQ